MVNFEGRATLINDTDKLYENTSLTMIGGKDLKFNDLKKIDFLLEGKEAPVHKTMMHKGAGRMRDGAEMAMAMDEGESEN